MLALACLRASGTIRAFSEIKARDIKAKDLYVSLGFSSVTPFMGVPILNEASPPQTAEATTSAVAAAAAITGKITDPRKL